MSGVPPIEKPPAISPPHNSIPWSNLPDTAVTPVAVSGASLFCYKEDSFHCLATDASGKAFPFKATKAFYSTAMAQEWVTTSFHASYDTPDKAGRAAGASDWIVDVPLELRGQEVAVLLIDENSHFMADWLGGDNASTLNLIADGSFENQKIDFNKIDFEESGILGAVDLWLCQRQQPQKVGVLIGGASNL
ncbi:MAG: hypothetical protein H7318_13745 [Oligoflexus sp.]|nr:hypothetical protein [Oligoflexus sp.]